MNKKLQYLILNRFYNTQENCIFALRALLFSSNHNIVCIVMQLGYINFSQEERNNLYKVIQSIREHHAIDELGIGRIRDAFSNKMFPGMSTLHNRAKYFVVLPCLYHQVEKGQYNSKNEVIQKVLDLEIKLTRQLVEWCKGDYASENYGITGSTVIDAAEKNSSKYVKYDPSYIYWGGLVTYEFVKTDGNVYQLIFERSKHPEKHCKSMSDGCDGDSEKMSGRLPLFDTGGLDYKIDGNTSIPIKLERQEAEFIKLKITRSEKSRNSLLSYLLTHPEIPTDKDRFLDLGSVWGELPDRYRRLYLLAARFSKFIYMLRIFYNYIYIKKTHQESVEGEKESQEMLQRYKDFYAENKEELSKDKLEEVLEYVDNDVADIYVKSFVRQAAEYVGNEQFDELEKCIIGREKETKGAALAKLTNWKKYVGKEHVEAFELDYRWSRVSSMIKEIKEGMNNGE